MLLMDENGDFNLCLFVNPDPVEVFFLVILTMSSLASLLALVITSAGLSLISLLNYMN